MPDSYETCTTNTHLSQPENRVPVLRLGAILMPRVLRKKYAQAEVAGARTLEGTRCCPDPHNPHSAQALRLPRERLNDSTHQLNLTTAPWHPNPTEDFCTHTLEFRYPHRRMNPCTHLVLYPTKSWSFWHCDLCEAFFKVSCLFLSTFSNMR